MTGSYWIHESWWAGFCPERSSNELMSPMVDRPRAIVISSCRPYQQSIARDGRHVCPELSAITARYEISVTVYLCRNALARCRLGRCDLSISAAVQFSSFPFPSGLIHTTSHQQYLSSAARHPPYHSGTALSCMRDWLDPRTMTRHRGADTVWIAGRRRLVLEPRSMRSTSVLRPHHH